MLEKPWRVMKALGGSHAIHCAVKSGQRPDIPLEDIEDTHEKYINLMRKCWDQKPGLRPTSLEMYRKLWEILSEVLHIPSSSCLDTFEKEYEKVYTSAKTSTKMSRRQRLSKYRRDSSGSSASTQGHDRRRRPSRDPSHALLIPGTGDDTTSNSKTNHRDVFADMVIEAST